MEQFLFGLIHYVLGKNVFLVYGFFFISSFLQMVFPPHPGDVILVFQGYLTSISDSFTIIPVLLTNLAATLTGSVCIYKLGFKNGDRVFEYRIIQRYILKKHKDKASRLFHKYGYFAVLLSKFIPGVNAVMILFAGIFKVRPRRVYLSIAVSSLVHHLICLMLGRFLGYNMENIKNILATYNSIIILFVLSAVVVYGVYYFMLGKRIGRDKV